MRHLHAFIAVAQRGSLQLASEQLAVSQPAISKTLAELEGTLGVTLFDRGKRGAVMTRDGSRLLPHALRSLTAIREGLDILADPDLTERAVLRLGVLPTLDAALLPAALRSVHARWRALTIQIVTAPNADLLRALQQGTIDIAVNRSADPELAVGLRFVYLMDDPLIAVVRRGHPACERDWRTDVHAQQRPVILPPVGTMIRLSAEKLMQQNGIEGTPYLIETLSVPLARKLTLEDDALWLTPRSAVEEDIAAGTIVPLTLPVDGFLEHVGVTVSTRSALHPAGEALIAALQGQVRSTPAPSSSAPFGTGATSFAD